MKTAFKILILSLALVLVFGAISSSAYVAYDTYTYSISGKQMLSPAAYSTNTSITSADMGIADNPLVSAADMVTDKEGNVYISDSGDKDSRGKVVVLNKYYKATHIVDSYKNDAGQTVYFNNPKGIFVNDADKENFLFVCDNGNKAIVVYNSKFEHVRTITAPKSPLLSASSFFPSAIAVDKYGRIFVIADGIFEGIIVLSSNGDFTGYIGTQKTSYTIIDIIWRKFQTDEQRAQQTKQISVPYNNLTVDADGFVYATVSFEGDEYKALRADQLKTIKSKAADSPL